VADKIRNEIIEYKLKPGEKLSEVDLCNRINVSRTPVREAFRLLQSEGYLKYQSNIGMVVAKTDLGKTSEIYEVRTEIERLTIKYAVRNCTPKLIQDLKAINEKLKNSIGESMSDRLRLDFDFHRRIATAAKNASISEYFESFYVKSVMIYHMVSLEKVMTPIYAEHNDIIAAIAMKDEALAAKYMEAHLMRSCSSIKDTLAFGGVYPKDE